MPDLQTNRLTVKRIVARLDGFARGLGLERAVARGIAEVVVADLPNREDEDLAIEARKRMLAAAM